MKQRTSITKQMKIWVSSTRINWIGFFAILLWGIIMGFVGVGLPNTINFINNLPENSFHGHWVSYVLTCLIFYIIVHKIKFTKEK